MPSIGQLDDVDTCAEQILDRCGEHVVLAAPLGLGKPNRLINALYRRIAADSTRRLTIHTALSLDVPTPARDIERRFAEPFLQRMYGADYPRLDYVAAMRADALPANIRIHEFYFQSGAMLDSRQAQRDYASLNYTFVARDLATVGINVVTQLVARRAEAGGFRYSLGCNPDVTLDLLDCMRQAGTPRPLMVGVVHEELPFLGGDAEVGDGQEFFDILLDAPDQPQRLFSLPHNQVDDVEYAIGLQASTLVRDGGTLQIGIGALSDALVHALLLRQQRNAEYRDAVDEIGPEASFEKPVSAIGSQDVFKRGLYGSSEMVMDGFMHLRRGGILTRQVYDDLALQRALDAGVIEVKLRVGDAQRLLACGALPARLDEAAVARLVRLGLVPQSACVKNDSLRLSDDLAIGLNLGEPENLSAFDQAICGRVLRGGRYLQGGFCLGSRALYEWLAALQDDDFEGLDMSRISTVNQFKRGDEALAALQRRDARFFNTCMMATALGAAVSDAIDDGRVVSGVGGQYNFVAMSYVLDDARSILMLRSTRRDQGKLTSNIRWSYAHATIPRHLRDIYVTEYGIADLRGKTDEECVLAMLAISDASFHEELVASAIKAHKLKKDFCIPEEWARNTSVALNARLQIARARGLLPNYPFGSDFTAVELRLLPALMWLKSALARPGRWHQLLGAALRPGPVDTEALARMRLDHPHSVHERLTARILSGALNRCRSQRG